MAFEKKGVLYQDELKKLDQAYRTMLERRSEGTGSAFGEHHVLVSLLREFGITASFESSSQVENFIEHLLIYNEVPDVY